MHSTKQKPCVNSVQRQREPLWMNIMQWKWGWRADKSVFFRLFGRTGPCAPKMGHPDWFQLQVPAPGSVTVWGGVGVGKAHLHLCVGSINAKIHRDFRATYGAFKDTLSMDLLGFFQQDYVRTARFKEKWRSCYRKRSCLQTWWQPHIVAHFNLIIY